MQRKFKDWYNDIPASQQKEKREMIMHKLAIKPAMFYVILNGGKDLKPAETDAIDNIAGEPLDYNAEDITMSTNLVKP